MKLLLISKYRTHIMGAAMLWIMWFHTPFFEDGKLYELLDGEKVINTFRFTHNIGFFGVDVFLLVSGLGLYFSMRRSKGMKDFYKKRAIRILPAYLIVAVGWYLFYKKEVSFGNQLLAVLGVNYFRGTAFQLREYFDWFLPTLMAFYLLTPLYDKAFQKAKVKWKFTLLCMMISPLLCIIAYHGHRQVLYGSIVRIPVFLLGYWIGWFLYEKKEEEKGSWMVYLSVLFAGITLAYYIQTYVTNRTVFWGLNCYPALLAAPGICATLAVIFYAEEKYLKVAGKVLLFPFYVCGRYSLEIYLFHQRLMEYMNSEKAAALRTKLNELLNNNAEQYYFIIALASIALAAALHELIALVIRLIKKSGKRKRKKQQINHLLYKHNILSSEKPAIRKQQAFLLLAVILLGTIEQLSRRNLI